MAWLNGYRIEPVAFMPTTLAGHMAKHFNHMVNSQDENNNIGVVYTGNEMSFRTAALYSKCQLAKYLTVKQFKPSVKR